ncbi:adenylate cyclase [Pseudodesulfovibrio mercurii]|uniref:Adenylate cyclase n=1 Tax=Pseudodesulfovibrio mercurii TaxID=641491 RepID=F0JEC9_9BACT|nr:class IV adenylate cyclase [Pseudodesulfovibrio mercurii]EGB13492.1 adenylate cyclase [Pseudodesulfovibrio mercurii]
MALECELKYPEADLAALADRLRAAGAGTSGRYFEANTVYDRPDRSLKREGVLLRLRERQGQGVLTVKRPPANPVPSALKVFEEIETGVDDPSALAQALEAVGFVPAFRYEKVREKWRYMGCVVCLDHLPFGDFAEIEGEEASVPACAAALGLDPNRTTKATYHGLNLEYRLAKGLEPDENFVFEPGERAALLDEIENL